MQKDIKLKDGLVRVYECGDDIEVMYWTESNNNEPDSDFLIQADNCSEYTTEENIDDFIANLEYAAALTAEDRVKLAKELQSFIKPMSSDR